MQNVKHYVRNVTNLTIKCLLIYYLTVIIYKIVLIYYSKVIIYKIVKQHHQIIILNQKLLFRT